LIFFSIFLRIIIMNMRNRPENCSGSGPISDNRLNTGLHLFPAS
jgi:hypothetical protein